MRMFLNYKIVSSSIQINTKDTRMIFATCAHFEKHLLKHVFKLHWRMIFWLMKLLPLKER
jgi:transcriptional regulator with AAA-type ATPase domain